MGKRVQLSILDIMNRRLNEMQDSLDHSIQDAKLTALHHTQSGKVKIATATGSTTVAHTLGSPNEYSVVATLQIGGNAGALLSVTEGYNIITFQVVDPAGLPLNCIVKNEVVHWTGNRI